MNHSSHEKLENNSNHDEAALKTCPCGHDRNHEYIIARPEYSGFGAFLNTFGISCKPSLVRYQCLKCRVVFDEITDREVLDKHL